jgi:hypothetical protein
MNACCKHSEEDHRVVNGCVEVIHYPSEDYPCVCESFDPDDAVERCITCGHPASKHPTLRVCRPASGEVCVCRVAL